MSQLFHVYVSINMLFVFALFPNYLIKDSISKMELCLAMLGRKRIGVQIVRRSKKVEWHYSDQKLEETMSAYVCIPLWLPRQESASY